MSNVTPQTYRATPHTDPANGSHPTGPPGHPPGTPGHRKPQKPPKGTKDQSGGPTRKQGGPPREQRGVARLHYSTDHLLSLIRWSELLLSHGARRIRVSPNQSRKGMIESSGAMLGIFHTQSASVQVYPEKGIPASESSRNALESQNMVHSAAKDPKSSNRQCRSQDRHCAQRAPDPSISKARPRGNSAATHSSKLQSRPGNTPHLEEIGITNRSSSKFS